MTWVGEMGGAVSLHQVRVGVSWDFAWLLGMEPSWELDWGLGMESGSVSR